MAIVKVGQAKYFDPGYSFLTSTSVSYTSTSGNLLVVFVRTSDDTGLITNSVSDGVNKFTSIGRQGTAAGGTVSLETFYAYNVTGTSTPITATFTSAVAYTWIYVIEFSGFTGNNPLDAHSELVQAGGSTTRSTGAITTRQVNEVLVVAASQVGFCTYPTPGAGYTLLDGNVAIEGGIQYKIVSAIQSGVQSIVSSDSIPGVTNVATFSQVDTSMSTQNVNTTTGVVYVVGSIGPFTQGGLLNLGTTTTDGVVMQNTTASTAGVTAQWSPRLRLSGTAWDTDDSVSRTLQQYIEMEAVSGTVPFGAFTVSEIEPGGATVRLIYIQSFGGSTLGTGAVVYNTAIGGDSQTFLTNGHYNSSLGLHALYSVQSGYQNNALGVNAGYAILGGQDNQAIGYESMKGTTSGSNNVAIGTNSLWSNISGGSSVCIGGSAGYNSLTGNNVCIGSSAGFTSAGGGNVFIGFDAGSYETGSNTFIINNQDRTNETGDRTKSLMYGLFNATAASQTLTINAAVTALVSVNAPLFQIGAAAAATSTYKMVKKVTGIADASATTVFTVTVPNSNQSAAIDLTFVSSNGSTDAFESSRVAHGAVVIQRNSGSACAATAAAIADAAIATNATGGSATHTLAYSIALGAEGAGVSNTVTIKVTIDDSGNVGSNQVVAIAELINSEASGCTIA